MTDRLVSDQVVSAWRHDLDVWLERTVNRSGIDGQTAYSYIYVPGSVELVEIRGDHEFGGLLAEFTYEVALTETTYISREEPHYRGRQMLDAQSERFTGSLLLSGTLDGHLLMPDGDFDPLESLTSEA